MENKGLLQVLHRYEHLLNGNAVDQTAYERLSEEERKELLSLIELAWQVRKTLAPVKPSAFFKQRLELELLERAHRGKHREIRIAPLSSRREMLIGAVVGSAVALVGGAAYFMHTWIRSRSQQARQISS